MPSVKIICIIGPTQFRQSNTCIKYPHSERVGLRYTFKAILVQVYDINNELGEIYRYKNRSYRYKIYKNRGAGEKTLHFPV